MNFLANILGCISEIILLWYYYNKMLGKSHKTKLLEYSIYILLTIYILMLSSFTIPPQLRTICAIIPICIPIILYEPNIKIKLLCAISYLFIQVVSESFTKAISLLSTDVFAFQIEYIQGVIISKLLALIIIFTITQKLHIHNINLPRYLTYPLLFIPFLSLMLIYDLRGVFYILDTPIFYLKYLFTIAILILSNLILFYLFEKTTELYWLKEKIIIQETLLSEQKNYYENAVTMYNSNRQLSHDFKNHLLILENHIQKNDTQAAINYISTLTKTIRRNTFLCSGFSAIDAILSSKKDVAAINFTEFNIIEFSIPKNIHYIENQLALILASSLDNALEATQKIKKYENRWINILLRYDETYLYLQIENTTATDVTIINNSIATTKSDAHNHGMGLPGIKNLVEDLHGRVKLQYENNIFSITIMIKLSNG